MLAHEDEKLEEVMPYFGERLKPCRAQILWGRAAKREPPCAASECVFHWYKEWVH